MVNTPLPTNELQTAGNERIALLHVTQQSWASVRTNTKRMRWYLLAVSALKGPRQEQRGLKASLSYKARPEVLPWEHHNETKMVGEVRRLESLRSAWAT